MLCSCVCMEFSVEYWIFLGLGNLIENYFEEINYEIKLKCFSF